LSYKEDWRRSACRSQMRAKNSRLANKPRRTIFSVLHVLSRTIATNKGGRAKGSRVGIYPVW